MSSTVYAVSVSASFPSSSSATAEQTSPIAEKKEEEKKPVVGYPVEEWVRQVVLPRIKRDAENTRYLFPDPLPDFSKFAYAHSWYKHFRNSPGKLHPMLRIGEEQGSGIVDLTKQQTVAEDAPLQWAFIQEHCLFENVKTLQSGYHVSRLPWDLMRDCCFYVSDLYSSFNLSKESRDRETSAFFAQCMLRECNAVRDRITRILLAIDPNPPTKMLLSFDPAIDTVEEEDLPGIVVDAAGNASFEKQKEEKEEEKRGVVIAGRFYELEFCSHIGWRSRKDGSFFTDSSFYEKKDDEDTDVPDAKRRRT